MGIHCILGRSISNIMIKTALLVTLFFVGSLSKSTSRNDDMETFLNIVFCACDENQNEISSGTFDDVDSNDDGEVTKEEVIDYAMSHMHTRAASMKVARGFHENAHIDAAVRVIGCVCDTDG